MAQVADGQTLFSGDQVSRPSLESPNETLNRTLNDALAARQKQQADIANQTNSSWNLGVRESVTAQAIASAPPSGPGLQSIGIPPPTGSVLEWAMANPDVARQVVETVNKLVLIQVELVPINQVAIRKFPLRDAGQNFYLPLPLTAPDPYVAPTGTISRAVFDPSTVTLAQLAQRVSALIQDLQRVGILQ